MNALLPVWEESQKNNQIPRMIACTPSNCNYTREKYGELIRECPICNTNATKQAEDLGFLLNIRELLAWI
jgi:hypothetical protein